jgi:hypothetical protein
MFKDNDPGWEWGWVDDIVDLISPFSNARRKLSNEWPLSFEGRLSI